MCLIDPGLSCLGYLKVCCKKVSGRQGSGREGAQCNSDLCGSSEILVFKLLK